MNQAGFLASLSSLNRDPGYFTQQNLPAALAAVPWLLACSALRAQDPFVAQTGRLFCAPQGGASGTFGDAGRLYNLN